jgi:hypothetical protein
MTTEKVLPTAKTANFSFSLQITDLIRRQKYMAESFACRLPDTSPFIFGDFEVSDTQFLTIPAVTTLVVIYSFDQLLLDITKGTEIIHGIACSGLFSMSGALGPIVVKGTVVGVPARLSYAYA